MNSKAKGSLSTARVLAALLKEGYAVSVPWDENCSYDLVADKDSVLYRVQCRTGHMESGSLVFSVDRIFYSKVDKKVTRRGKPQTGIDYYGVYCPEVEKVCLVPSSAVKNKTFCYLRVDANTSSFRGSNARRLKDDSILWAMDYEI